MDSPTRSGACPRTGLDTVHVSVCLTQRTAVHAVHRSGSGLGEGMSDDVDEESEPGPHVAAERILEIAPMRSSKVLINLRKEEEGLVHQFAG